MQSSQEQAYSAIERSYAEGRFRDALEQAQALQPQLERGHPDQLDQRLQLLIGHIHLYGLNQRQQAEAAYRTALEQCREPIYRQLAEQGLGLCQEQEQPPEPAPAITPTSNELPATPWLTQLNDPQQALAAIQQAWATVIPAATDQPSPIEAPATTAATPWQQAPAPLTASPVLPQPTPTPPAQRATPPQTAVDEPAPWDGLEKGLLLVRLSQRSEPSSSQAELEPAQEAESPLGATVAVTAPSLGAAWTLFKRNWRTYLIVEGLIVAAALLAALLQLIGGDLQGLALLVAALALNIVSNLLGVSLQVAPALAFHSGRHPSAAELISLLRRDAWRLVRAGVVVGLVTSAGLVLLIVPGLLVAIATPVIVRRVVCNNEPAWPALLTSVKEVSSGPAGAGLLKWELIAGGLIVASVLLCGLPLLITVPLGGIAIQHYVAWSGLGLSRQQPSGGDGSGR